MIRKHETYSLGPSCFTNTYPLHKWKFVSVLGIMQRSLSSEWIPTLGLMALYCQWAILALGKELPFLSMLKQNKRFSMQYANQQLISNLVIATKMSISVLVLFPMAYVMYHITRTNVIWTQFLWLSFENYWTKTILSENIPSASILINYMNEGLCLMFHQMITITQALSLTTTLSSIVL